MSCCCFEDEHRTPPALTMNEPTRIQVSLVKISCSIVPLFSEYLVAVAAFGRLVPLAVRVRTHARFHDRPQWNFTAARGAARWELQC